MDMESWFSCKFIFFLIDFSMLSYMEFLEIWAFKHRFEVIDLPNKSIDRILSCFAMVAVLNQLEAAPWVPYLSIICVMGYIFGFAIGPGPIPWIWNTEFFKQSARAGGASEYFL